MTRGNGVISEVDENYVPLRQQGQRLSDRPQAAEDQELHRHQGACPSRTPAVQDSQGPIADRTREHLGPTDLGILHFRENW